MSESVKIKKAVIPAAGLGTRMLPIARTVPKEVLPIVDRPAISYLVEEAVASGATDVLIINGRGKNAIEDYFDFTPEYENKFLAKYKDDHARAMEEIEKLRAAARSANVFFIRQKETLGLGHAIWCAREFTGDDPFYVLYGDDVIFSQTPVCEQLRAAYEKYGLASCGVKEVPMELVRKYCTLKMKLCEGERNIYAVSDMIEKPSSLPEGFLPYSILGRVLMTPEIHEILTFNIENEKTGAGGEYQLTDAMQELSRRKGMVAVDFEGKRYDMGSKLGFLMANVERAVKDPELGADFTAYLKEYVKTL